MKKKMFIVFVSVSLLAFFILPIKTGQECCGGPGPLDELGWTTTYEWFGGTRIIIQDAFNKNSFRGDVEENAIINTIWYSILVGAITTVGILVIRQRTYRIRN